MTSLETITVSDLEWNSTIYVKQTAIQIWEDMPRFLLVSIVLCLSAILPVLVVLTTGQLAWMLLTVLTFVPAWSAFCYMVGKSSIQVKPCLKHFRVAFFTYFSRSVLVALPIGVFAVVLLLEFSRDLDSASLLVKVGLAVQMSAFALLCIQAMIAIPMVSLFDLSVVQTWIYSFVLVVQFPIVALGLASLLFLLGLIAVNISPAVWLVVPMIFVPFEVNATLMLTKQRLEAEQTG